MAYSCLISQSSRVSRHSRRRTIGYYRSISSVHDIRKNDHLFKYTSGRWLWNESEQRKARYQTFSVKGLIAVACKAIDSGECISLEKIGEGNYNKAFKLVMRDGRKVIAKIPNPNAGPAEFTTASEVATMDFARTILNLPVPKVLAWSETSKNPVDSEYIIMEEAKGTQLHDVWHTLELRDKCDIVDEIVDIEKTLLSVSFSKIGALYFKSSGFAKCVEAEHTATHPELEKQIESRFEIGPIVRREFWTQRRSEMLQQCHGPWSSAREYLESIARREIEWITTYVEPKKMNRNPWIYSTDGQYRPEAHISLLDKFLAVVPDIVPKDLQLSSPLLWHPDFHAGNIYVDDTGKISSIIDWQGSWTAPLFIGANPPKVLDYSVDMMMKFPNRFKELDDSTKDEIRYQVAQSILIHSYETRSAAENPLMYKMMRNPQSKTLKELEAFANATWGHSIIPLRECLIRIARDWDDFCSARPCPYQFTQEELTQHEEEGQTFNDSRDFWKSIRSIVSEEGYTSIEDFDTGIEIFHHLRENGLSTLHGDEREEFDRQTRWVVELGK